MTAAFRVTASRSSERGWEIVAAEGQQSSVFTTARGPGDGSRLVLDQMGGRPGTAR